MAVPSQKVATWRKPEGECGCAEQVRRVRSDGALLAVVPPIGIFKRRGGENGPVAARQTYQQTTSACCLPASSVLCAERRQVLCRRQLAPVLGRLQLGEDLADRLGVETYGCILQHMR